MRNVRLRVIKSLIAIVIIAAAGVGVFLYIQSQDKQSSPVGTEDAVVINEILTSNSGVLSDEKGNYSDWIELYNPTDSALSLGGFGLSDEKKDAEWTFPAITLEPKGYLVVFASGDNVSKTDAPYQHTNFKLSSSGGGVYLFNADGKVSDSIEYKAQTENVSVGRDPQNLSQLAAFENPTPGFSNDDAGYGAFRQSRTAQGSALLITEVNPSNTTPFIDNKGNQSDYIEIFNSGTEAFDLTGYGLSDDPGKVLKWKFPAVSLKPGAYLVVFASGDEKATDVAAGFVHTSFRISTYRESIVLSDSAGYIIDQISVAEVPSGQSYARVFSGGAYQQEWAFSSPSPASENAQD